MQRLPATGGQDQVMRQLAAEPQGYQGKCWSIGDQRQVPGWVAAGPVVPNLVLACWWVDPGPRVSGCRAPGSSTLVSGRWWAELGNQVVLRLMHAQLMGEADPRASARQQYTPLWWAELGPGVSGFRGGCGLKGY